MAMAYAATIDMFEPSPSTFPSVDANETPSLNSSRVSH